MMGNEAFRSGDFKQAEEYYTSALLQWDKVCGFFLKTFLNFSYNQRYFRTIFCSQIVLKLG